MSEIADRFVAVLDANVLYPYRVRDALLWFAHTGLYRARWSDQIIDEWRRSLLANRPALQVSVDQQISVMRRLFPESWVNDYEDLTTAVELPDKNDRHVLAAAIRCGAQNIVTENLKHFPSTTLKKYDIDAITADQFLTNTFELYPLAATKSLKHMRLAYKKPAYSASEFIAELMRAGLGQMALRVKEHIDLL